MVKIFKMNDLEEKAILDFLLAQTSERIAKIALSDEVVDPIEYKALYTDPRINERLFKHSTAYRMAIAAAILAKARNLYSARLKPIKTKNWLAPTTAEVVIVSEKTPEVKAPKAEKAKRTAEDLLAIKRQSLAKAREAAKQAKAAKAAAEDAEEAKMMRILEKNAKKEEKKEEILDLDRLSNPFGQIVKSTCESAVERAAAADREKKAKKAAETKAAATRSKRTAALAKAREAKKAKKAKK